MRTSPGGSRAVATPSKPLSGKIPDRRRKWYPVEVLASQGNRSVDEIVRWIESGELKGFNSENGWIVHRDQLDAWRELCARPKPVFTTLRALLDAYPELREVRARMSSAIFAKPSYTPVAHRDALNDWNEALLRLGVVFQPSDGGGIGFHAGLELPDPDEPGFQPIDRNRFDAAQQQEER